MVIKKFALCAMMALFVSVGQAAAIPRIAVYVTGEDAGVNRALTTRLLEAFVNSNRYAAVERSDAFVSELDRELTRQHSGAVDDNQIVALGRQSGVQFVCVADITHALGTNQVSARLIDVETANVTAIGVIDSDLANMEELTLVSRDLVTVLLGGTPPRRRPARQARRQQQQAAATATAPTPAPTTTADRNRSADECDICDDRGRRGGGNQNVVVNVHTSTVTQQSQAQAQAQSQSQSQRQSQSQYVGWWGWFKRHNTTLALRTTLNITLDYDTDVMYDRYRNAEDGNTTGNHGFHLLGMGYDVGLLTSTALFWNFAFNTGLNFHHRGVLISNSLNEDKGAHHELHRQIKVEEFAVSVPALIQLHATKQLYGQLGLQAEALFHTQSHDRVEELVDRDWFAMGGLLVAGVDIFPWLSFQAEAFVPLTGRSGFSLYTSGGFTWKLINR